jgi:hypothetical protein
VSTTAAFVSLLAHLFFHLRHELPLHAFARLIGRSRDFFKGLIQGKIVSDRVLQEISQYMTKLARRRGFD